MMNCNRVADMVAVAMREEDQVDRSGATSPSGHLGLPFSKGST